MIIDDEADYKSKSVLSGIHSKSRELEKTVEKSKENTNVAGSLLIQVKDFFKLGKQKQKEEKVIQSNTTVR